MTEPELGYYQTMQEMCEYIHSRLGLPKDFNPEELYNMHPKGELQHVFELYELAKSDVSQEKLKGFGRGLIHSLRK